MDKNTKTKRSYKRWPGLYEAAAALSVSYGHLRLCLAGERSSTSLLKRYRALQARQKPSPVAEPPHP